jgi:hypothetical protein
VFRFADEEHAAVFGKEFGGEPIYASESGKGRNWSQWKKARISRNLKGLTDELCAERDQ